MLKTNTESVKGYKEMNIPYTLLSVEEKLEKFIHLSSGCRIYRSESSFSLLK